MRRTVLLLTLIFFIFQGFAQKDVSLKHSLSHFAKINSLSHKQGLVPVKGQTFYRLDTFGRNVNYAGYIGAPLQPLNRVIYTYDNYNYVIDALTKHYDLNSQSFVDFQEDIYTRDANHNIVEHVEKSGYGSLDYDYRDLYVYDANNNLIVKTHQLYNSDNNNWQNNELDSFYYNNRNLNTLMIEYYWNGSSNSWEKSWKEEYTYDSFNNKIVERTYSWYNSAWTNNSLDSFYYQNGFLMREVDYFWSNGNWQFVGQYDYTYDSNGNMISEVDYDNNHDTIYMERDYYNEQNLLVKDTTWDIDDNTGNFGYSENNVYLYDNNNNLDKVIEQNWDSNNNQWVNAMYAIVNFNLNENFESAIFPEEIQQMFGDAPFINLPTDILIKRWRADSSVWNDMYQYIFRYKTIVTSLGNVSNSQQITLYPNPASNVININLPDEQKALVMIYDENGRVVRSSKLVTGQVSVKSLPTGTYFVVVQGKNKIYVGKFLKK